MKQYVVSITDGNDIRHNWNVSGGSKFSVLKSVLETFNDNSYGMPYGIQLDGIKSIEVYQVDMSNKVWGYSHE